MTLRNTIIASITETGMSLNAIARNANISQSSLWRFVYQNKGLQFDALERLWMMLSEHNKRTHE